jgi:hypothetical protein
MRSLRAVLGALVLGVLVESALCVVSVACVLAGGFGPCGPTGDAPGFVRLIHQPGFWAAGFFVQDSSPMYLALSVIFTTAILSGLAFVVLKILNQRRGDLSV